MEPFENENNEVENNETVNETSLEVEDDKPLRVKIESLYLEERFEDGFVVKTAVIGGITYVICRGVCWVGKKIGTAAARAWRSVRKAWREDKEAEKERKAEQKRKIKEQSEKEEGSSKVDGEEVETEIVDKSGKTVKSNRK